MCAERYARRPRLPHEETRWAPPPCSRRCGASPPWERLSRGELAAAGGACAERGAATRSDARRVRPHPMLAPWRAPQSPVGASQPLWARTSRYCTCRRSAHSRDRSSGLSSASAGSWRRCRAGRTAWRPTSARDDRMGSPPHQPRTACRRAPWSRASSRQAWLAACGGPLPSDPRTRASSPWRAAREWSH